MRKTFAGLTDWQAAMLLMTSVSITGHVIAIPEMLHFAGRDAWLSVIVAIPPALVGVWAVLRLTALFEKRHPADYLQELFGTVLGKLVILILLLFLLLALVLTLRNMLDFLKDVFFPLTPGWAYLVPYLLLAWIAASGGLVSIAHLNQFILLIVSVMGMYVGLSTTASKEYTQVLPFLELGLGPVLQGAVIAMGIFGEFVFLAFLAPYVEGKRRFAVLGGAVVFVALTIVGPVTAAVAQWGQAEAIAQVYPSYEGWRMVSLARFIERIDIAAVHQWVAGAFPRVALLVFTIGHSSAKLVGSTRRKEFQFAVAAVAVVLTLTAFRDKVSFEGAASQYYALSAFLGIVAPVIFLAVAYVRNLSRPGASEAMRR